jgi:RNA ligase (TIGR02306 family)
MRKLATIRKISEIAPIKGADAIVCAIVDGWKVVVKSGEFKAGDLAIYFEIDSWIPHELAPFLSKDKDPRTYKGVQGERLRTVKLRGQISQGLLLPHSLLDERDRNGDTINFYDEGADVTAVLNVQKWEQEIPAQLRGVMKGNFPSCIPKTDQERVQNLVKEISAAISLGKSFEVTEKLEGSSMTCYLADGMFGICSRNIDLEYSEGNTFWATTTAEGIENKMRSMSLTDYAIQGELVGPGIQNNIYNLDKHAFYVFDVYDIAAGEYLNPEARRDLVGSMGLKHVPVLGQEVFLGDMAGSVADIVKYASAKSVLNPRREREGVVFKEVKGGMTFKAISNKYLLSKK